MGFAKIYTKKLVAVMPKPRKGSEQMKLERGRYFAALAVLFMAVSVGTAFGEQPDKWVRYVEATGSQYVDTGIIVR